MQITNAFDASRVFLNPMIPEVMDLTERLFFLLSSVYYCLPILFNYF